VPTEEERAARIREGVDAIVAELGEGNTAELPQKTFTEVVNLSEYPTALMCEFDESFLAVPEEIIVDAMLMHQRYFPIYKDGALTNKFIIVTNGDVAYADNIKDGNQRVVAARLYDAKFFYDEDLKRPLEAYVERLDEVVFQEQLGTVRAKTDRVSKLASYLALDAALDAAEREDVARAALLAKADLVTNAVIEFTSVQGVMGSYYATAAGESDRVARAIADHYRPRFAGDDVPAEAVGKIVAIADKLDTVCGLFAINQPPTGSSDPFALRRAALGIIAMLTGKDAPSINLEAAINESLKIYAEGGLEFAATDVAQAVVEFFVTRTKVSLKDAGVPVDAVEAVLAAGIVEPAVIYERAHALDDARKLKPDTFEDLATAYARANNLRDAELGTLCDAALFSDVERALDDAVAAAGSAVEAALEAGTYAPAIDALAALRGPVDEFFESTMIMDEDTNLRENRLRLLNRFVGVFASVADFSKLVKGKA
jgi:glycyl-tRNA synthetase beta chain